MTTKRERVCGRVLWNISGTLFKRLFERGVWALWTCDEYQELELGVLMSYEI
jgi:hypothetical protein